MGYTLNIFIDFLLSYGLLPIVYSLFLKYNII
jgi:hypothetical protein